MSQFRGAVHNGNETGTTNENSTTVTKVYDNADRLTSITNKMSNGGTVSSFTYAYQNDGLRTSCTESNGDVVSYGYDAAHRLTSESRTGLNAYSRTYSLDGESLRSSQVWTLGQNTITYSYTYSNDDELTSVNTTAGNLNTYGYNNNGEQTSRTLNGTAYTLTYDYDGQLTSITQGTTVTSFAYDALGRRFSRTAGGTTTEFLYAGSQVLLEKQGSSFTATYTYGNDLVRKDAQYPMYDGIGSYRTATNSSGLLTGSATYEGFGQTVSSTLSGCPYRFGATSGYRNDSDAGLMLVGARYYDPQVGQFITRDTDLSQLPYVYCDGDPINNVDPSGHWKVSLTLGGVLGIGHFGGWGDFGIEIGSGDDGYVHGGFVGHLGGSDSGVFSGPGHGKFIGIGGSFGPNVGIDTGNFQSGPDNGWSTGGFAGWDGGVSGSIGSDLSGNLTGFGTWPFKAGAGPTLGIGVYTGPQIGHMWQLF